MATDAMLAKHPSLDLIGTSSYRPCAAIHGIHADWFYVWAQDIPWPKRLIQGSEPLLDENRSFFSNATRITIRTLAC
ncbi:MAG: hypothetical protein LW850_08755 [Planctomycetaceae bacterium]|nr:hypothetical protein [Planctomycetaceae bacterium]